MKMKKFTAALAAAALMMTAVGCGSANTGNTADTTAAADNAAAEGKTYNIGIVQLVQHEALDAATQGFMDTLTEKLGDNVKFDLQNANGESTNCSTIATGFVASNVDLILANSTAALQASGAATSNIPILGTSVTDYATALEIDDWTGVTGGKIYIWSCFYQSFPRLAMLSRET